MPPSETFRDSLRAGRLQDAFLLAMGQVVELKVTTWVALERDITTATAVHRLQTRIDLVEGDIENEIGERFITQTAYQPLRQFHLAQVAQSRRIIRQNIQSLQKLFTVLAAVHSGEPLSSLTSDDTSLALPGVEHSATEMPTVMFEESDGLTSSLSDPLSPETLAVQAEGDPWPGSAQPFVDLNLPAPNRPIPPTVPDEFFPEQPDTDWQFSDEQMSEGQLGPALPDSGVLELSAPRSRPGSEEDEDWGEFVEFVEEASFEPEIPSDDVLYNPFALPLDDSQPYTSVVQEDWAAVPPSGEPGEELPPHPSPEQREPTDAETGGDETWGKDTLGEDFYPPPRL